MIYFRVALITLTALFVAFHSQVFIQKIEPNLIFSWTAALLIEAFLISLSLQKGIVSKLLIVPVFLISTAAAGASFIVSNQQLLDQFLNQKRVITQLQNDISDTSKQLDFDKKYTTQTLKRERLLKDELSQILKKQNGDLTLINAGLFFIFVFILQLVSVFTAISLKQNEPENEPISEPFFEPVSAENDPENEPISEPISEPVSAENEPISEPISEPETPNKKTNKAKKVIGKRIVKMKENGMTAAAISAKTGVSISTVKRMLQGHRQA